MEQRIEKTVRKILETSNMDDVTEYKIRKQASEDLGLDLSKPPYKAFVRQVVESFLEERQQRQGQAGDEEEEEEGEERQDGRDYDDEGNLIICKVCFPLPSAFYFSCRSVWLLRKCEKTGRSHGFSSLILLILSV